MGAPKRKHPEHPRPARRPSEAEREAAEDRADAEAYDRARAEWAADGYRTVPLEEVKRRHGLK